MELSRIRKFVERKWSTSELSNFASSKFLEYHSPKDIGCSFKNDEKWEPLIHWSYRENIILPTNVLHVRAMSGSDRVETLFIQPFTGTIVKSDNTNLNNLDILINAGGSIWALDFFSSIRSSASTILPPQTNTQYAPLHLAVGMSRIGFPDRVTTTRDSKVTSHVMGTVHTNFKIGNDDVSVLGSKSHHSNLLQIWQLDLISKELSSSADQSDVNTSLNVSTMSPVRLSYFVDLSGRGSVWQVSWKKDALALTPSPHRNSTDNNVPAVVGLLAVVCGDGGCLILALPCGPPSAVADSTSNDAGSRNPTEFGRGSTVSGPLNEFRSSNQATQVGSNLVDDTQTLHHETNNAESQKETRHHQVLKEGSALVRRLEASNALVLCVSWVAEDSLVDARSQTCVDVNENASQVLRMVGGLSDGSIALWCFPPASHEVISG